MKAIHAKLAAIIPAHPGFYVLEIMRDEHGYPSDSIKLPIVAWAMEENDMTPYPIILEGVKHNHVFILQPDGSIERPNIDWFPNLAEWLTCQQGEFTDKQRDAAKPCRLKPPVLQ